MRLRQEARFEYLMRGFVVSAAVILFLTAVGKLLSVLGSVDILDRVNPLFDPLTHRQVMFGAVVVELVVGFVAIRYPRDIGSVALIAGLAMIFLVYRIGLWSIGYTAPCDCLGAFTEAIGMSHETAGALAKGILGYLLVGSVGLLAFGKRRTFGSIVSFRAERRA